MLPFTTYSIPESPKNGIPKTEKWLCMVVDHALTPPDIELLQKISSALKADFDSDVHCIQHDPDSKNSITASDLTGMKLIISFGVPPAAFSIWIDMPTSGLRILETCSIIRTVSLKALAGSAPSKKDLWSAMQTYSAYSNE